MSPHKPLLLALVMLVLLALPSEAAADTITFENFADSTPITTQISGLIFTNATAVAAGVSLNEFELPPHSGSVVLFDDGGPISIAFANPVTSFSGYFTYGAQLTIIGFDSLNNQIAMSVSAFSNNLALSGEPGSSPNELLVLGSNVGISRILIMGAPGGGSFAVDDISVSTNTAAPEPASLTLLLLGSMALLGYRRRR